MELAWQKERESQKKLINELNTMARDLKATLLEVEKERDRERLDAKRKLQVKIWNWKLSPKFGNRVFHLMSTIHQNIETTMFLIHFLNTRVVLL